MGRKDRYLLGGFMAVLSVVLGAAVFGLLALEHGSYTDDIISMATMESRIILKTVVAAIQTTASMRTDLQDAGVPTNIVQAVVAKCGTGRMLQRLGTQGMFEYLVCQDDAGIVAGYGVQELNSIDTDPFLREAMDRGEFRTRLVTGETARIEAVLQFTTEKDKAFLMRLCIGLGSVKVLEERQMRRTMLFGGAMVMVTLLLISYLFSLHNTRLLARERDVITGEVVGMQQQLRQQERVTAMGRLAASVAHEIRNPLNAIQILVQRLERETVATPETAAKSANFTRVIKDEMKRLNQIVEEFLEFARVRSPMFLPMDPVAVTRDVCCLEQGVLQERHLSLSQNYGTCTTIHADLQQIKQALLNILRNAIEATPADGQIIVRVEQDTTWVLFRIEDTGIGMTAEEREQAFDLYYSKKERGSGIGLAITRRIVEQHHGEISLLPRQPRGTIVEMRIPTNLKA